MQACRRRKKRCDGNRPACSACSGWDTECVYPGAQTTFDYGFPTPHSLERELEALVQNPAFWDPKALPAASPPVPLTALNFPHELSPPPLDLNVVSYGARLSDTVTLVEPSRSSSRRLSGLQSSQVPPQAQIIQLTNEFFERHHPFFACIHKEKFLNRLRGKQSPGLSTPLEWAIVATAARVSRDANVSTQAYVFLQNAVESLSLGPLLQENVLQDLQAAVWCVFSLYSSGEITKAVVLLAQAYTLACLHGLNRLDDPTPNIPLAMQFSPVEEEECRCTLWALFVLDRHINYLIGRHFVIDDSLWCVNYPLDDRSLQHGIRPASEAFNRDLEAITAEKSNVPLGVTLTRLVCKTLVILGRIAEHKSINPMPTGAGSQHRLAEFHELQSALACFWVILPPCVHNVAEVPAENVLHSVWLLIILHQCSTVLFYITEAERRSGTVVTASERDNFACSYKSVDKVVSALRTISGLVVNPALNPMLASAYFLCCRFIVMQARLSQQQSYRLDLTLVLKLLERMAEGQVQLPLIYKDIIDQELVREMQGGGAYQSLLRTDYCFML
ncbi:hypothetical protein EYZ11_011952 [Aspergillus tanneri]|uniref:Zn(2)-C6 fungal-type domain-containing protein n=1 Tax=Aspergillus tanneri TaxID=1220188 RepID=A0A4S3J6U3_9EURO|nr:hypothetical protein EYZ11_011952 [Aspergillus tanneri]